MVEFVAGDVIADRFQLRHEIGYGTFSKIWHADERGQDIAIKIFDPSKTGLRACFEAFKVESLCGHLVPPHRNVLTARETLIVSVGQAIVPILVMPYCAGAPLALWQQQLPAPAQSMADRLRLITEIAQALAHVHSCAIAHLDISLANVLVENGRPRLIDFGASMVKGKFDLADERKRTVFYNTIMRGPDIEMAQAEDIFALAVLACIVLINRHPVCDDWQDALAHRATASEVFGCLQPRSMGALCGRTDVNLPLSVSELMDSSLDADWRNRPGSQSFADALTTAIERHYQKGGRRNPA